MNYRSILLAAGLFGLTGVAFGAFGAHGLREALLEHGTSDTWETGARYHLLHAVALLGLSAWARQAQGAAQRRLGWAAVCWCIGILLFSGSLYGLAAGGPHWLGPVTPLGGLVLLAGWFSVCLTAFAPEA